jgi:hypothetical protein
MADEDGVEARAPRTSRWRRLWPSLVAIALMAVVLARADRRAFFEHLARVPHAAFFGFVLCFTLALLAADAFATTAIYRRSIPLLRYREMFVARGASYLPSLLNHHVGQAWLTWFMARSMGVDLRRMVGTTLLVYASWGGCMLGLACLALPAAGMHSGWLALPLALGLGYLLLLAIKPAALEKGRVLGPLFEAGVGGHLHAMLVRFPHLLVLFAGSWLPFWFFEVRIPLLVALSTIPVLMVAVTLPITPQGFGTREALAVLFFERYATGATEAERIAAVVAATTSMGVTLLLVEGLIGLLLLRYATRMLPAG